MDDLLRRRLVAGESAQRLDLRRDRNGLERPREHAATLADQRFVVILPTRARQSEEPLALLEGFLHVRSGIEEDIAMIEGGEEPDLARQEHAVAEHIA